MNLLIKKSFLIVTMYLGISVVFCSSINEESFIGYFSNLVISQTNESPAHAALQDLDLDLLLSNEVSESEPGVSLKADDEFRVEKLIEDNQVKVSAPSNTIKLSGLQIEQPVTTESPEVIHVVDQDFIEIYNDKGELKPLEQRKKEVVEYFASNELESELGTLQSKMNDLIQEELNRQEPPAKVIVATAAPTAADQGSQAVTLPGSPAPQAQATLPTSQDEGTLAKAEEIKRSLPAKYVLEGQIVVTGGLGYTGLDNLIDVFIVKGGEITDTAHIDIHTGRFYIETDDLTGVLVAELRNTNGDIQGVGEFSLFDFDDKQIYQPKHNDIDLIIAPYEEGVHLEVISAYSYDDVKYPVENAKVVLSGLERHLVKNNKNNLYSDNSIVKNSTYMARAYAPGHWGSLKIGFTGIQDTIRLFSEKMIDSLLSLTLGKYEKREAINNGIVWGEITLNGTPISGAQVEIAGEEEITPVYYNKVIPDNKLDRTTSSGQFTFLNLPPGSYALRVKYQSKYYPAELVAVAAGHVSYVNLKIEKSKIFEFKSVDAFTKSPLDVVYSVFGYDDQFGTNTDGHDLVYVPRSKNIVIFDVDAGTDYPIQRVSALTSENSAVAQLISYRWLENLLVSKKLNLDPDKGLLVGYVGDYKFEAFINDTIGTNKEIFYFDASGNIVPSGVPNGGFVIVNLEVGPQTVSILPEGSSNIHSQMVVVDTESVFLVNY